ncbi:MAG: polysaccharide deacetylase family protein [Thermoproteota archaeon]
MRGAMALSKMVWPNDCLGALSLTFDDGMLSQLERAVPLLEKFGFRGTFYLNPSGDDWLEMLEAWREVYDAGHEIGNHTLSHTCSSNFSLDPKSYGTESMSLEDIERDILEAERCLDLAFPKQKKRSFCYPCYEAFVGRGISKQSYVPIVAKYFIAGRGRGEIANSPANCDLHYLWSWPVERATGAELVGLAEQVTEGRWGIMTFHGIHQGHLPVSDVDLEELLKFLSRNRKRIWVAPVAEIAQRILDWRGNRNL